MTIQTINIGNVVNDGLGDNLRSAFQKVNDNFAELTGLLTITASNAAGNNGYGIYSQKVGTDLRFKNLLAGNKITIDSFTDSLRINSTSPDSFIAIETDNATVAATAHQSISIKGTDNITVVSSGSNIVIDTVVDVQSMLLHYDFGTITNNAVENVIHLLLAATQIDFGTITGPSGFTLDLGQI